MSIFIMMNAFSTYHNTFYVSYYDLVQFTVCSWTLLVMACCVNVVIIVNVVALFW